MDETPHKSNQVSRRTLVIATAWTVPVVATAVGTPFAAASDEPITFSSPAFYISVPGDEYSITGTVPAVNGVFPSVVALTYSAGFRGSSTAVVNPNTGSFSPTDVTGDADGSTGLITASAAGVGTGAAQLSIQLAGQVRFSPNEYSPAALNEAVTILGSVIVYRGDLPAALNLTYEDGAKGPASASVNSDGSFTAQVTQTTYDVSGTVTASHHGFASDYCDMYVSTPIPPASLTFDKSTYTIPDSSTDWHLTGIASISATGYPPLSSTSPPGVYTGTPYYFDETIDGSFGIDLSSMGPGPVDVTITVSSPGYPDAVARLIRLS